ncbi:hypothetical protein Trydic_g7764 [Trypoxylus dichotomus]
MTIAFWNANGLPPKKYELEEFIQRHQLDAVLIGETHLRYKAFNRQLLEDELSEIFDTRGAVILAGDLNAKHPSWNSRVTNASGNCLRRFADDFHLLDATADPTIAQRPGHSGDEGYCTIPPADRSQRALVRPQPRVAVTWTGDTGRRGTPDASVGVVARFHGPPLRQHRSHHGDRRPDRARSSSTPCHAAFILREIRDLIREKNRLRRQWQRTLNPALKADYNQMARRTKVALNEFRHKRWDDFMIRASESPSEFWRAVKVMKKQRVSVPPIHGARGVVFTNKDKAQEDLQNQAGRTAVHVEDSYSRSAARVSDLTPVVQHLHQRHPGNHAHQPGDTALDALQDWYARIATHPEKSAAVLFSIGGRRRRKHGNPAELTFQGGIIPWQQQVKYLGVTLDSRVNWVPTCTDRSRTSDVGNPLSVNGGAREARFLT